MRLSDRFDRLKRRVRAIDPYATRGVPRDYHRGMQLFWWFGIFIASSFAFADNFVQLYVLALGATSLQVGAFSSISSLMAMLAPIPGAQWAARWGKRKWVVVIAFSVRRLVLLCVVLAPFVLRDKALVVAVIGLMALRTGLANLSMPAWSSLAGDLVPLERRGRFFSARKTVMAVASLVFVPLAGQVIAWVGEPSGYQVSFLISIVFGIVAIYLYAGIPERSSMPAERQEKDLAAFWRAFKDNPTFLRFTLSSMVFNFFWQLGGPYFGVYQVKVLGATPQIVGVLGTAGALTRILGRQVWGRAIDRRGAAWSLVVCRLIIPVLPFIWFPLTNAWQVLFVTLPSAFLWAGNELANFNLQLELSDPERRTQAIASYTTLIGLANILGPLVGGLVVETLSYKWSFAISGVGRLVGALLLMALLKPFKRAGEGASGAEIES